MLRAAAAPLPRDMEATGQGLSSTREEAHDDRGQDAVCAQLQRPGGQYGQGISIALCRSPATQFCYLAEQHAELGRGRAGRSEAACHLGQTEIVEATAACSGFARCSCGLRRPVQRWAGCALSAASRGFGSLRARLWSLYIEETVTPQCGHGVPGFRPGRPPVGW